MKVDASKSTYHEAAGTREEFTPRELRRLRLLLRRLRFLEAQVQQNGGLGSASGSGGAAFAEWEVDALEYVLTEIGFLADPADPEDT